MSTSWKYEKIRILNQRMLGLGCIFILIAFILIGRIFYLQVLQGDKYKQLADKNRTSIRLTLPSRGYIYDKNGVKLAENRKTFQAVLFKEQTKDVQKTLDNFEKIIPLDEDEKMRIEKERKWKRAFMPIRIKDNLTFEDIARLQLNAPDLQGIQIEEEITRRYATGENAAHLIGYVSLLTEKDVENDLNNPLLDLPGYRIGRTGIEQSMEETLQGKPGMRKTEINAFGRSVRVLDESKAEKGENITLTIDSRLQEFALQAMNGEAGSVIVMDVHTGAILTLISSPSFDPNVFTMPISSKNWKALIENERNPLQNKAISGTYSPGSIFKLIVALAGLETGHITADRKAYCSGKVTLGNHAFHCWKKGGHGAMTLETALMHSCDVYFYEMAQQIGSDKILEVAARLGFGEPIDILLKGERAGLLPSKEWKKSKTKESWRVGDTLNLSIGQGFLNVTPLQMLFAVAQIANGGYKIKPHLIAGTQINEAQNLGFKPYDLKLVQNGMNMVVNQQGGTGYASRFDFNGQKMAGKTASTQVRRITMKERETGVKSQNQLPWKFRDHAMFAAFAPVNNPKYAIIVMIEHGGGGSRAAAPVASKILKETLRLDALTQDEKGQED